MGIKKIGLTDALFGKVRQRVLGVLYGQPDKDFYMNEIIRITSIGTGSVQRELAKLTNAGILTMSKVGNQKRYQANKQSPLFHELHSIVLKTVGLADLLKLALEPMLSKIHLAFVYGSIAKHEDTSDSDIDILLIGDDLTYADIFESITEVEGQLGRKINPTFYTPAEWLKKRNSGNNFITKVIQQSKIYLIGTEDELNKLG